MDKVMKEFLYWKNILVSETGGEDSVASVFGLARLAGIKIEKGAQLANPEVLEYALSKKGRNIPRPFYKNFPESARQLSPDKLLFDQVVHYTLTYGFGRREEAGHSLFETDFDRAVFSEEVKPVNFDILTEEEADEKLREYFEAMLAGTRPLGIDNFFCLSHYITTGYKVSVCNSKDTAIRLALETGTETVADFLWLSDVLNAVEIINFESYHSTHLNKLNLRNFHRKQITAMIDCLTERGRRDVARCMENKASWSGLLHHIHYRPRTAAGAEFAAAMRGKGNFSVSSAFEKTLAFNGPVAAAKLLKEKSGEGALIRRMNYLLSRRRTKEQVEEIVNMAGSGRPRQMLQLLISMRENNREARVFAFTKHGVSTFHREKPEEARRRRTLLSEETRALVKDTLIKNIKDAYRGRLGKVYIHRDMKNIALPISESSSSSGLGVLPKGSKIYLPRDKKLRAFIYWEKVDDIDLSIIGMGEDGESAEFSWRTMAYNQTDYLTYSGDQTSGYNGGSEYFDLDPAKLREAFPDIRYLVFCANIFTRGCRYSDIHCTAGYMLRQSIDSGEVFEPKTVKSSFGITTPSNFAYLFAFDRVENCIIWLNMSASADRQIAALTDMGFIRRYLDITHRMNMYSFFALRAGQVTENPEDADIVVSDIPLPCKDGAKIIKSSDFEKIAAIIDNR